jgi:hypothetical protein
VIRRADLRIVVMSPLYVIEIKADVSLRSI